MQNTGSVVQLPQVSPWARGFVADNVGFINEYFGSKNPSYNVLTEATQVVKGYNHFLLLQGSLDNDHYMLKVYLPINNGVPEITGHRLLGSGQGGITLQQQVSPFAQDFVALRVGQINKGFEVVNDNYTVLTEATQLVKGVNHYLTLKGATDKLLYTISVYVPLGNGEAKLEFVSRQGNDKA